jgi:signal transduction histidine kinase
MDAEAFVREIVEQHRVAMPLRAIDVTAAPALPPLHADAQRLQQALVNLLDNAIKYSPEDRPIRLSLDRVGDSLRVSVHDQGIGIPAAEQDRIFQRFYRGSSAAHRTRGLGVGLYITSQIVEAHGGRMWLQSTEGEGSVFGFDLPPAPA